MTPDFYKIFGVRRKRKSRTKNLDVSLSPDRPIGAGGEPDDDEDAEKEVANGSPAARLANLVATLARQHSSGKVTNKMMTSVQKQLEQMGAERVAKAVVSAERSFSVTGDEFASLVQKRAVSLYPALRPDVAFSKLYCAQTPEGELLRRADNIIKHETFAKAGTTLMPTAPMQVGGDDARAVSDPRSALAQLNAMAEKMRAASPELSPAVAFSRVYQDSTNKTLAARERAEARARLPTS